MTQGFSLIADPQVTEYRNMTISSQAYTIGDAVQLSRTAATVTPATASTTTLGLFGVAMETVTSSATTLLVAIANMAQRWTVSCTNTPVTTDNYQRMILTDKATVNNTHTDDTSSAGVVTQVGVKDATAKIIVVQINKAPNVTA